MLFLLSLGSTWPETARGLNEPALLRLELSLSNFIGSSHLLQQIAPQLLVHTVGELISTQAARFHRATSSFLFSDSAFTMFNKSHFWHQPRQWSEDHPQVIARKTQDSAYSCIHGCHLSQWRIQGKMQQRCTWESPGGTRHNVPSALSRWSTSTWVLQHLIVTTRVKCCLPGMLLKESGSRAFTEGAGHIGSFCLTWTKIPDSQTKSKCSA